MICSSLCEIGIPHVLTTKTLYEEFNDDIKFYLGHKVKVKSNNVKFKLHLAAYLS